MNDLKIWRPEPKLIVVEREVRLQVIGEVEFQVDGKTVGRRPVYNDMLEGMGFVYAYACRTGTCKMINGMLTCSSSACWWLSTPARTAGGQGANEFITVQSTWTNNSGAGVTCTLFQLSAESFDTSGYLYIAEVTDSVSVPNLSTLTVNWTIRIESTRCSFSALHRNDMAQGINPQGAPHGGTLYNFSHVQFVWAAGNSGLQAVASYEGGTGYDQKLVTIGNYLHAAAAVVVLECEIYNSNGDLVEEIVTLNENLGNGETIQVRYTTTYLGMMLKSPYSRSNASFIFGIRIPYRQTNRTIQPKMGGNRGYFRATRQNFATSGFGAI